jgi:hypothetical protein
MTQEDSVRRLRAIESQIELISLGSFYGYSRQLSELKFEAAGIAASHLGSSHHLVTALRDVETRDHLTAISQFSQESVAPELIGLVRAAAVQVRATSAKPAPTPEVCDPDLWQHIKALVEIGVWDKIPSAVVTFTEDWIRKRGGDPRNKGAKLIGSDLFNQVLRDLPLGGQASEQDGWRFLGMGLVQAVGNLHRHNIERRSDAEPLAWRVIGLASLLIGEMKATHREKNSAV